MTCRKSQLKVSQNSPKDMKLFELKKIIDILVNLIKPLQFIMFKDLSNFSNKLKIISFSPIFPKRLISKT